MFELFRPLMSLKSHLMARANSLYVLGKVRDDIGRLGIVRMLLDTSFLVIVFLTVPNWESNALTRPRSSSFEYFSALCWIQVSVNFFPCNINSPSAHNTSTGSFKGVGVPLWLKSINESTPHQFISQMKNYRSWALIFCTTLKTKKIQTHKPASKIEFFSTLNNYSSHELEGVIRRLKLKQIEFQIQ